MRAAHSGRRSRGVAVQSLLSGGVATVAVATGLLLDVVAAAAFGAGRDTDAFVVAARLPLGLTAILMVIGNQVLVPTFATWTEIAAGRRDRRLTTTTLLGALLIGAAISGLLLAASPLLVQALAPGFDGEQLSLASDLLKVMVWIIPLTAGSEVLRAWLNARHLFVVPAAMTVVLNAVAAGIIAGVGGEISILPVAYLVGSAVQFVCMLVFAAFRGLRLATPTTSDEESKKLLRLTARPSVSASLNPATRAIETAVASFLPPGSATVLHYAHRLVHAIGGTVLFRSVMVALLPRMTRAYVNDDQEEVGRFSQLGARLMIAVSLPVTAFGVALAVPAASAVFGVGRFSPENARLLGVVIAVLSLSFLWSALQRAYLSSFYAVRNTRQPLNNTIVGSAANVVLMPLFVLPLAGSGNAVVGLAAAYVVAQVIQAWHARRALRRSRLISIEINRRQLARSVVASALGGLAAYGTWLVHGSVLPDSRMVVEVLALALAGVVGCVTVACVELTDPELRRRLRRRSRPDAPGPDLPPEQQLPARAADLTRRGVVVLATLVAVLVTASVLTLLSGRDPILAALPVGLILGAAFLGLAFYRFEFFVLAVLLVRTSLDALKFGGASVPLDPAALLGMLFLGSAVVWLAARWRQGGSLRLSPLGLAAVGFAAAAFVGVLISPDLLGSAIEWSRIASVCMMIVVIEQLAVRPRYRTQLLVAMALSAVVPLTVAAWQIWTGTGLFEAGGFGRATGTFTHSNPLAAFLMVMVVMSFAFVVNGGARTQGWSMLVLLAAGAGLFVTYTRAAWVAAVIGVAIIASALGRRWLIGLVATLAFAAFYIPGVSDRFSDLSAQDTVRGEPSNSLAWRLDYWSESLALSADTPLSGIGLKQVAAQTVEAKQPHNDFLRAFVEMGVLGLAAYGWLMWQFIATGRRAAHATRGAVGRDRALAMGYAGAAVGYVVMCLVANLMSQVVVGLYFGTLAAAAGALAPLVPTSRLSAVPAREGQTCESST